MPKFVPPLVASALIAASVGLAPGGAMAQGADPAPAQNAPTQDAFAQDAPALNICLAGAPAGLDPVRGASGSAAALVNAAVFETLVTQGKDAMTALPALALWWENTPDRRQYTFRLRSGVGFHKTPIFTPTRPLGPDDVVFTFARLIDPAHPLAPTGAGGAATDLAAMIERVEKLGDNDVRFTLKAPNSGFLTMLAGAFAAIQSAEYGARVEAAGQGWMLDTNPVGTGPFSVSALSTFTSGTGAVATATQGPVRKPAFEIVDGAAGPQVRVLASIPTLPEAATRARLTRIELSANPGYWRGAPSADRLVLEVEPDIATRYGRLVGGQCQIMPSPAQADIAALSGNREISLTRGKSDVTLYLAFNTERPPLDDKWVRLALAEAIDVEALARLNGISAVPARAIPQGADAAFPVVRHIYDLSFAQSHLAGAGVRAPGIRLVVPVASPGGPTPIADAVAAAWESLGANVIVKKTLWADMAPVLSGGDYDVALLAWRADSPGAERNFRKLLSCDTIGDTNASRWCDTSFMADLQSIRAAMTPADQLAATLKAAQRVATELPILPLVHLERRWAVRAEVEGLDATAVGALDLTGARFKTPDPVGGPLTDTDLPAATAATAGDAG